MKKSSVALLVLVILALLFGAVRWWTWGRGRVLASVDTDKRGRVVVREIPYNTNPLEWMFDASDYIYRFEFWGWPHIMTNCTMHSGDSYRAQSARIDYTPERTIFHLDDLPGIVLTSDGQWSSE